MGPRTSKMIFWTIKYTNTQIQVHKYTNTAFEKGSEIPFICLYFWKANEPRTSKMIFWTVKYTNTQLQRHKYTNTLWWSARNTQHVLYFRKARGPRTSKNDILGWQKSKSKSESMNHWPTDWLLHCTTRFIYAIFLKKIVLWKFTHFVTKFILLKFTHFCVEKNLSKNFLHVEKMTNMRSRVTL